MNFTYFLAGLHVFSAIVTTIMIDEERKPVGSGVAILNWVLTSVIVYGLFNWI